MKYYGEQKSGGVRDKTTALDVIVKCVLWVAFFMAALCVGALIIEVFLLLWSIDNVATRSLILAVIGYSVYTLILDLVYRFQRWRKHG